MENWVHPENGCKMEGNGGVVIINKGLSSHGVRFNIPLDTKYVTSEMLFPANLLASTEKIKIKAGKKIIHNTINLG